jgi:copper homeostasis protein CutC
MNHPDKYKAKRYDSADRCKAFTDTVYHESGDRAELWQKIKDLRRSFDPAAPEYKPFVGEMHGHSVLSDGRVDVERTRALVKAAHGMETTFHRAVDMTEDYGAAVEAVIEAGCDRILTSGGYDKAIDGIDNVRRAVEISRGRIEIMAGSGVVAANAVALKNVGVDALHFSAKKMVVGGMQYRNPRISMGGSAAVDEFSLRVVDEAEVTEILKLIR